MSITVLNSFDSDSLQYMPYGVTTLEMNIQGDAENLYGAIYPSRRAISQYGCFAGFADQSNDFLVIGGAGTETGLQITNENIKKRLFMQILHRGETITDDEITLLHEDYIEPIKKIRLFPAVRSDPVRMCIDGKDPYIITFRGSLMPLYYSRWFPPRGDSQTGSIRYEPIEAPAIKIVFNGIDDELCLKVKSDIDIYLEKNKIAKIGGDWRHSCFHTEIFSLIGDQNYIVLRCWFYWIRKTFSKYAVIKFNPSNQRHRKAGKTRRNFIISQDVEVPDIERFDFLIDTNSAKIILMGTDFHYQELWYIFKNTDFVRATIANDLDAIGQVMTKLKNRFNPPINYNPIDILKEVSRKNAIQGLSGVDIQREIQLLKENETPIGNKDNKTYRGPGAFRKHIPFTKNGKPVPQLVSSIVTS